MNSSRADSLLDANVMSSTKTGIMILMSSHSYVYSDASEYVLVNFSFVRVSWRRLFHCRPPCLDPYRDLLRRHTSLPQSPWVNPSSCSMYTGMSIFPLRYACKISMDRRCQSSMAASANMVLTVDMRTVAQIILGTRSRVVGCTPLQ